MFISMEEKLSRTLFAFDLDGTLVHDLENGERGIPQNLKACVNRLSEKHQVIIATGRRFRTASIFSRSIQNLNFLVCNNGLVIRRADGSLWHKENLEWSVIRRISEIVEREGFDAILAFDGDLDGIDFALTERFRSRSEISRQLIVKHQDSLLSIADVESLEEKFYPHLLEVAVMAKFSDLLELQSRLVGKLPAGIRSIVIQNCGYQGLSIMEILPESASKWAGISRLALELNCDQIVGIGDDENDREMIEFSDIGVVMSHARDHIKSLANVEAEGADGLVNYLEKEWMK